MARPHSNRSHWGSKKNDKKRLRKKQAALVKQCVQALNSNADIFRSKISDSKPSQSTKAQPNGTLKHFKPIRIEIVDEATVSDAIDMLESKFTIDGPDLKEKKE